MKDPERKVNSKVELSVVINSLIWSFNHDYMIKKGK